MLSNFISKLRNPADRETVVAVALQAVSEALQPKWAAIAGRGPGGEACWLAVLPPDLSLPDPIAEALPVALSLRRDKPVHVGPDAAWLEDLPPEHSAHIREMGAELFLPVVEGPTSVLMIILGSTAIGGAVCRGRPGDAENAGSLPGACDGKIASLRDGTQPR